VLHGAIIIAAVAGTVQKAAKERVRELPVTRLELPPLGAEAEREPHSSVPEEPDLPSPPSVHPMKFPAPRIDVRFSFPSIPLAAVDSVSLSPTSRGQTGRKRVDTTLTTANVDRLPELLGGIDPHYPVVLQGSGLSGVVELEYVIATSGLVEAGTMRVRSSPHVAFSRSAGEALRRARFKPALVAGRPVPVLVRQRIHFLNR
jgi:TonB family protein